MKWPHRKVAVVEDSEAVAVRPIAEAVAEVLRIVVEVEVVAPLFEAAAAVVDIKREVVALRVAVMAARQIEAVDTSRVVLEAVEANLAATQQIRAERLIDEVKADKKRIERLV